MSSSSSSSTKKLRADDGIDAAEAVTAAAAADTIADAATDAAGTTAATDYRVHRVNFHRPDLHPVNCAAYSGGRLAVARADASVEIYSEPDGFYVDRRLPGCLLKSVEGLCWLSGRLFCTGQAGYVHELDLAACDIRRSVSSHTDGNWCIAGHSASGRLAVGSDSGAVVAIETEEDDLRLGETLGRLSGRVLSLAWRKTGRPTGGDDDSGRPALAAGSVNCVFLLFGGGARGSAPARRLPLARRGRELDTLAWAVMFLGDALVSGDSAGHVTIWDSVSGAQIRQFRSHRADVLTLAPTRDRRSFFAAGVDPTVQRFDLVAADGSRRWEAGWNTRELSHDVRTMCCTKRHLVTGGTNCRLVLFDLNSLPAHQQRRGRIGWPLTFAPRPESALRSCPGGGGDDPRPLALLRSAERLRLYRLGTAAVKGRAELAEFGQLDPLPVSETPDLVLELLPAAGREVLCADVRRVSRQGGYQMAYSDTQRLRLFNLVQDDDGRGLRPVKVPLLAAEEDDESAAAALTLRFTAAGHLLCIGRRDGRLRCLSAEDGVLLGSAQPQVGDSPASAFLLAAGGPGGRLAALGTHEGHVLVYDLPGCRPVAQLGRGRACRQPTALAFHPSKRKLFVAYSDRSVALYDVDSQSADPWCMNFNAYVSPEWRHLGHFLHAAFVAPGKILLANDRFLVALSLYRTVPSSNIFRTDAPTVYRMPQPKPEPTDGQEEQWPAEEEKKAEEGEDGQAGEEPAGKKSRRSRSARLRRSRRQQKPEEQPAEDEEAQAVAATPAEPAEVGAIAKVKAEQQQQQQAIGRRHRRRRQVSVSEAGDERPEFSVELSAGQASAVGWVAGFQFLLGLEAVSRHDLCVVSLPPEDYLGMLQPPAFRKRFGI